MFRGPRRARVQYRVAFLASGPTDLVLLAPLALIVVSFTVTPNSLARHLLLQAYPPTIHFFRSLRRPNIVIL